MPTEQGEGGTNTPYEKLFALLLPNSQHLMSRAAANIESEKRKGLNIETCLSSVVLRHQGRPGDIKSPALRPSNR